MNIMSILGDTVRYTVYGFSSLARWGLVYILDKHGWIDTLRMYIERLHNQSDNRWSVLAYRDFISSAADAAVDSRQPARFPAMD